MVIVASQAVLLLRRSVGERWRCARSLAAAGVVRAWGAFARVATTVRCAMTLGLCADHTVAVVRAVMKRVYVAGHCAGGHAAGVSVTGSVLSVDGGVIAVMMLGVPTAG